MNNRVDTTLNTSVLLSLSANTEARFQTWMQRALATQAVSLTVLSEGQTAVVTLTPHERDDRAPQTSTGLSTHQVSNLPNTTCTLHWQSGRWGIASLSSLTRIEEAAPLL